MSDKEAMALARNIVDGFIAKQDTINPDGSSCEDYERDLVIPIANAIRLHASGSRERRTGLASKSLWDRHERRTGSREQGLEEAARWHDNAAAVNANHGQHDDAAIHTHAATIFRSLGKGS